MTDKQRTWLGAILIVVIIALLPLFGGESLSLSDLADPSSPSHRVFFSLRLPRLAIALVAGGSLAMLGGTYQILFHNPLAEPYILGVSSAVTLGAASAEIFLKMPAHSGWGIACGALAALAVTGLMILLFLSHPSQILERIVLFGMGVNFILSSLLFLMLSYFNHHLGGGSLRWLFGQIPWVGTKDALWFVWGAVPFVAAILILSRKLDGLSLGDAVARTLGVSPERTRAWILLLTSAFLSVIVSLTGAIGFVGLVIPHATRLLFRPASSRALLALSFAMGAVFLAFSDVLSRVILPPFEFPIGILTTLLGGPLFLVLLSRRR